VSFNPPKNRIDPLDGIHRQVPGYPTAHRVGIDRYHKMIDAGILDSDDKCEMLEGFIYSKRKYVDRASGECMPEFYGVGIDRYHQLIDLNFFDTHHHVECIEGLMVDLMPQGRDHVYTLECLSRMLMTRLPETIAVRIQFPIRIGESEPEPDVVLATPRTNEDRDHPTVEQIHVMIEVSESSLIWDRSGKRSMYASAGIREYWIVNLVDHQVEVYTDPIGSLYRTTTTYTLADSVPLVVAGQAYASLPVKGMM
jgi:Uma2 family endonuclease